MAQAISNQAVVGTTIKTGAGEYPIGFMSVLNVHTYRVCCRLPTMNAHKQIRSFRFKIPSHFLHCQTGRTTPLCS